MFLRRLASKAAGWNKDGGSRLEGEAEKQEEVDWEFADSFGLSLAQKRVRPRGKGWEPW